jgi:hypothetical protein
LAMTVSNWGFVFTDSQAIELSGRIVSVAFHSDVRRVGIRLCCLMMVLKKENRPYKDTIEADKLLCGFEST